MFAETLEALDIQTGALLVGAPAKLGIAHLNGALADYGLCLPIDPLAGDVTLADLVRWNAGGRRRMRYGSIGRYVRAATLGAEQFRIGGPTLKRSTGYGLNRALAGRGVDLGAIHEVMFNLRPLPASRAALLIRCRSLADACRLGATLALARLELSALAFAADASAGLLLVELEGPSQVLDRQLGRVHAQVAASALAIEPADAGAWSRWEELAAAQVDHAAVALDLTLPRAALPELVERAQALADRYGFGLTLWGDAGVGALHLRAHTPDGAALDLRGAGEADQALAVIAALARTLGGDYSTEFGRWPAAANTVLLPTFAHMLSDGPPSGGTTVDLFAELRAIVGEAYLLTRDGDVATYETDASSHVPPASRWRSRCRPLPTRLRRCCVWPPPMAFRWSHAAPGAAWPVVAHLRPAHW